jgi:hypothetical protein
MPGTAPTRGPAVVGLTYSIVPGAGESNGQACHIGDAVWSKTSCSSDPFWVKIWGPVQLSLTLSQ